MTHVTRGSPQPGLVTPHVCITRLPAQPPSETREQVAAGKNLSAQSPRMHRSKKLQCSGRAVAGPYVPSQGRGGAGAESRSLSPNCQASRVLGKAGSRDPPTPSEFPVSLEQVVHQLLFKYPLEGAGPALRDRLEASPKWCSKKCPSSREHEWIPAAPAVTALPPLPAAWLLSR